MKSVVSLVNGTAGLLTKVVKTSMSLRKAFTLSAVDVDASASTQPDRSSNVRDLIDTAHGEDYTFLGPTGECLCGSTLFIALVEFDEDGVVASYFTDGLCASCHAVVTLVTEADRSSSIG